MVVQCGPQWMIGGNVLHSVTLSMLIALGSLAHAGAPDNDGDGHNSYTDCDDSDASIYPGATELCDGIDNNCNGIIDENCVRDGDGDGYYEDVDCDDTDAAINPGATEIWYDGVDQDCDEASDYDQDGDGFESDEHDGDDCDDTDELINPDAAEECDGIDNNCDGEVDEGCDEDDEDDEDSSGADDEEGECFDEEDEDVESYVEECGDLIDNDCDGEVDEGCDEEDSGRHSLTGSAEPGCKQSTPAAMAAFPLLLLGMAWRRKQ